MKLPTNKNKENIMSTNQDLIIHQKVIVPFDGDVESFIERRKTKGFSQKEMAAALGFFDAAVIGHFETGAFGLDNRCYTLFLLITDGHPRYKLELKDGDNAGKLLINPPSDGKQIRATRINAHGMTQIKMAKLLGLNGKTIISKYENDRKSPSLANWTVFLLLSSQHPFYKITPITGQQTQ